MESKEKIKFERNVTKKVDIKFPLKERKTERIPKGNVTKKVDIKFPLKVDIKFPLKERKTERIPIFLIYKENHLLKTDVSNDVNDYELYGFLKLFIERMGKELKGDIESRTDDEEII